MMASSTGCIDRRRGDELGTAFGLQQAILGGQAFGLAQCAMKFDLRRAGS